MRPIKNVSISAFGGITTGTRIYSLLRGHKGVVIDLLPCSSRCHQCLSNYKLVRIKEETHREIQEEVCWGRGTDIFWRVDE